MGKDPRTYIKLHDGMPENHKIVGLSDAAFRLYIEALCWCSRNRSDGKMPAAALRRLGSVKAQREIGAAGLIHAVDGGAWEIHDYLEHQRSKAEIEAGLEQRRSAGRNGGLARSKRVAKQKPSESLSETSSETQADTETDTKKNSPPTRLDVEQLCGKLAEWLVKNGAKPPETASAKDGWRREARLLLDTDERPLAEALALVDWCQQDSFWRSNILSMTKFRKQYDALRLRSQAPEAQRRVVPDEELWMQ
jgi:hypothetical protein